MAISAVDTAKLIIESANEADYDMSNLKLQKLLYYVQGWHRAITKSFLFDDDLEARVNGPVCRVVYNTYRDYGRDDKLEVDTTTIKYDDHTGEVIAAVMDAYGKLGAWDLVALTHIERPWKETREKAGVSTLDACDSVIPKPLIAEFFIEKRRKQNAGEATS